MFSAFIKRYQVPIFFVAAFGFVWLLWGTIIAQEQGLLSFHVPEALGYFGLTIATILVAWLASGKAAILDLVHRVLRWRVGAQWYAFAVLVPVALCVVAVGAYKLFGGSISVGADIPLAGALLYFVYFTFKVLITEELAWRGFALPRLQAARSALAASMILGVLWGVWHTPLFFVTGSAQSRMPFLGFVLFAVGESILTTWIYNNTGGSVWIASIFHSASDASLAFSGAVSGDLALFWVTVAVFWAAAKAIVIVEGAARLSRGKEADRERLSIPGYLAEAGNKA